MKKLYLIPLLASMTMLTGCLKDDVTATTSIFCCNLVTPDSENEPSFASAATYVLNYDYSDYTVAIGCSVDLGDATAMFTTDPFRYTVGNTSSGNTVYTTMSFGPVQGMSDQDHKVLVPSMKGYATDAYRIFSIAYPGVAYGMFSQMLVTSYKLTLSSDESYQVTTFPKDATYMGSVKCQADGADDLVATDAAVRLIIDPETSKAVVLLYNIPLEKDQAGVNLMLSDVPVTWLRNAYAITADSLVPRCLADTSWEKNETYAVTDLVINSIGSTLLGVSGQLTVGGRYHISFAGNYLNL